MDLIKREDAIKALAEILYEEPPYLNSAEKRMAFARKTLESIPSAEKQGEWIMSDIQCKEDTDNGNYQYICSVCGHGDIHARTQEVPYCWWCGARMKGANDETD